MGKKRVVIGITVNLEHYENLRLEVEGEVGDPEEAAGLVAFLDELLDRFGEGDAEVRKRIEDYRQRVLPARLPAATQKQAKAAAGKKKAQETVEKVKLAKEEEPIEAPLTTEGDLPELLYHKPADAGCVPEGPHRPGGEGVCEIGEVCEGVVPEPPAASAKEVAKKEPAGGLVCSRCGAAITRQQEQLSQLFVGKALCRQCMDSEE